MRLAYRLARLKLVDGVLGSLQVGAAMIGAFATTAQNALGEIRFGVTVEYDEFDRLQKAFLTKPAPAEITESAKPCPECSARKSGLN